MTETEQLHQIIRDVGELVGQAKTLAPTIENLRRELSTFREESAREGGEQAARIMDIVRRVDEMADETNRRLESLSEKWKTYGWNERRVSSLETKMDALEVRTKWRAELLRGSIIVAIGALLAWLFKVEID